MRLVFVVLFLVFQCRIQAQSDKNVEGSQLQLGLPLPSVLYEIGTSKNATASLEVITGFGLRGCSGCTTNYGIYPILRGQYRYYYNMERRLAKGKRIAGNSGNYIAGTLVYQNGNPIIGDLAIESAFVVGPVYGIQRTYRRGFFYRLEGGLGYYEGDFGRGATLILGARIGWAIRTRH